MTSLQKESEWEQSFDENFPDFGWCLRTDVGVNPSKDRVKSFIKEAVEVALVKGYEDGYKIGHWEGFEEGRNFGLKEREKEIAEEVKKLYSLDYMKKIVQIVVSNDDMLCLTEDGKVYERGLKDRQEIRENASPEHPHGRVYVKGTYYWKEVPVEEKF